MARKHEVLALHAKGMSSPEIAGHLGCMDEYVRATLQRAGLRSHSKRGRVLPRCQTKGHPAAYAPGRGRPSRGR